MDSLKNFEDWAVMSEDEQLLEAVKRDVANGDYLLFNQNALALFSPVEGVIKILKKEREGGDLGFIFFDYESLFNMSAGNIEKLSEQDKRLAREALLLHPVNRWEPS